MKKIFKGIIYLGIITIIGGELSQPDKAQHVEALAERIMEAYMNMDIDRMSDVSEEVLPGIKNSLEIILNSSLNVKDMGILNIGEYDMGDGQTSVTVGILNHVFVLSNNGMVRLKEEMNWLFNGKNL